MLSLSKHGDIVYKSVILIFRIRGVISQFFQGLIMMTLKYCLSKKRHYLYFPLRKKKGGGGNRNNNPNKKIPILVDQGFLFVKENRE